MSTNEGKFNSKVALAKGSSRGIGAETAVRGTNL